jgi:hypothetical protein
MHAQVHARMHDVPDSRPPGDSTVGPDVVSRTMCESGTVGVSLLHMSVRVVPVFTNKHMPARMRALCFVAKYLSTPFAKV